MSTALGYFVLLLPVIAIAWIIWSYRRKTGNKEARSREREATLVGLVHATDKGRRQAPAERSGAVPIPAASAPAVATVTRRDRFLTPPETLLYYLLRTALPGYEVFPRASLGSVLDFARPVSENGIGRTPPNAHDLDFVVCDKAMRIVAAIQLEGRLKGPQAARVERGLAAAGIRMVTIDPKALPRREELGALILGSAV